MYRVLASLTPACNDRFTALQLPTAISIDPARRLLVLPYYVGEDLGTGWSEADGGALLSTGLVAPITAVLEDLAHIDTRRVTSDPVLSQIPGLIFDHATAFTQSVSIVSRLAGAGLLSHEDCVRAERLLAYQQRTPMIVNNGDFYPRNLIAQPSGRIVIVDWETYSPNSPFHTIDHPENVAAVFYAHMWGNPAWQTAYLGALHDHFGYSSVSFAKGVVIAALELANMWLNETDRRLAAIQASTITSALAEQADH